MTQTVALAVDGMEHSLLSKWREEGHLPNLDAAMRSGVWGSVECDSLSSAKQWTTHFTGVSPEVHGVEGFLKSGESRRAGDEAPDVRQLVNLEDIEMKTYPELLSESGYSVGLLNPLPIWPPLEFDDGICVSGMLTPPSADTWAFPDRIQSKLQADGYRIDVLYGNRPYGFVDDDVFNEVDVDTLYEDMFDVLDHRITAVKDLIRDEDVDFLYALLKSIDIIQHCFWTHMESDHEIYGSAIFEAYQMVDELVGWISDNSKSNLVVFSDHGFKSRTTRPPEGIHRLAVLLGDKISVPSVVKRTYQSIFYRDRTVSEVSPAEISGIHARPAVWIASGADVKSSDERRIKFEDIPATLLALMDAPIPNAYAGELPEEVLNVQATREEIDLSIRRRLAIEDDDRISERLHNLGYAEMVDDT